MSLRERDIQPGYNNDRVSVEYIEQINCEFAKQVYSRFAVRKFGVESCQEDNYDKSFIRKQYLDLSLLLDPAYCIPLPCPAPCGVRVSMLVFNATSCFKPSSITTSILIPEIICNAPTNAVANLSYQS